MPVVGRDHGTHSIPVRPAVGLPPDLVAVGVRPEQQGVAEPGVSGDQVSPVVRLEHRRDVRTIPAGVGPVPGLVPLPIRLDEPDGEIVPGGRRARGLGGKRLRHGPGNLGEPGVLLVGQDRVLSRRRVERDPGHRAFGLAHHRVFLPDLAEGLLHRFFLFDGAGGTVNVAEQVLPLVFRPDEHDVVVG